MPWEALIKRFDRFLQADVATRILGGGLLLLTLYIAGRSGAPAGRRAELEGFFNSYTSKGALDTRTIVAAVILLFIAYALGLLAERLVGLLFTILQNFFVKAQVAYANRPRNRSGYAKSSSAASRERPYRPPSAPSKLRRSFLVLLVMGPVAWTTSDHWDSLLRDYDEELVARILAKHPAKIGVRASAADLGRGQEFTVRWLLRYAPDMKVPDSLQPHRRYSTLATGLIALWAAESTVADIRLAGMLLTLIELAYILYAVRLLLTHLTGSSMFNFWMLRFWIVAQLLEDSRPSNGAPLVDHTEDK